MYLVAETDGGVIVALVVLAIYGFFQSGFNPPPPPPLFPPQKRQEQNKQSIASPMV